MNKKVLVTGGSGFIGSFALLQLLEKGYEVFSLVPPSESQKLFCEGVQIQTGDLLDPQDCRRVLNEVRPTHLLHLAWDVTHGKFWTTPNNLLWVGASLYLIKSFYESGGKRAVCAGTCAEYDWSNAGDLLSEDHSVLAPQNLYGHSKNALREVIQSFCEQEKQSWAWGRIFMLYGPGEFEKRIVSYVIQSLLMSKEALCGKGDILRDFLHVEDVARGFVSLLESDQSGCFNIASGEGVELKELILEIGQKLNKINLIQLGAHTGSANEAKKIVGDNQKLLLHTNWKRKYSLDEGLDQTIHWWETQNKGGLS